VTVIQCLLFERGKQRVSYTARLLACIFIVFLLVSSIVSLTGHLKTLDLLYYFSYVKLAITIIKYCPQAWMNYKRKSTEGWSIGNILLDLTGGLLSFLQMFFLAKNYNDWSSIFGSPTKLGLALFSILFDILFIAQHYICYRNHDNERTIKSDDIINENSPILSSKR
jgi:LCT (Lysosomal Cystine Transporter) family transporter